MADVEDYVLLDAAKVVQAKEFHRIDFATFARRERELKNELSMAGYRIKHNLDTRAHLKQALAKLHSEYYSITGDHRAPDDDLEDVLPELTLVSLLHFLAPSCDPDVFLRPATRRDLEKFVS